MEAPLHGPQAPTVIMCAVAGGRAVTPEDLRTGLPGILLSSDDPEELVATIRRMGRGAMPLPGKHARRITLHVTDPVRQDGSDMAGSGLSPREQEVLRALAAGLSYKMIGGRLGISFETVRSHMKRIYGKLRVHSSTEAVVKAMQLGLVARTAHG